MKASATSFYHSGLAVCLCLVFTSFAARCQPVYGGITANSIVNFNGHIVTMDSFDSTDPNHSIWQTSITWQGAPYGFYSDTLSYNSNSLPSRTSDFTLATDGSIINVGNGQIYGFVNTAPAGSASLNANGSVGDLNWVYGGSTGIEPGHGGDNMTAVFTSKSLPVPVTKSQTGWWPVPTPPGGSTNIGGINYSLLITNRPANSNLVYYSMGQLTQNIFVSASNVVLYLTNGMTLSGNDFFMLNSNADVSIYSSGNISVSGSSEIVNLRNNAHALSIYDVAGYTNLTLSFSGTGLGATFIYAPGSSVTFAGAGNQVYSFIGAIFCNDLSVNGHYNFHYDESLADGSFPVPPAIIQQPTNEIVQAGSNATFSVVAGGSPTAYQWYFNQSDSSQITVSNAIDGATSPSLTITNAQLSDDGFYFVELAYTNGSVSSLPVWLAVYTNAAATLSGSLNVANGQFDLVVQNVGNHVAGMPYILQASTNLTDWVPILTNTSPFIYTETNAFPQRYYRAVFIGH